MSSCPLISAHRAFIQYANSFTVLSIQFLLQGSSETFFGGLFLCFCFFLLITLHRQERDSNSGPFKLSKWELMDKENKMGKLIFHVH